MDSQQSKDRIIGIVLGFVFILAAAALVGVPIQDLLLWVLVFATAGLAYLSYLRRRGK